LADSSVGLHQPSLWEKARKTAARQPRKGQHRFEGAKCRQYSKPILVTEGVREGEGALNYSDFDVIRGQHFDHVKAEGDVRHLEEPEPVKSTLANQALFLGVHGIEWSPHLLGSACLHLGKDQCISITAYQIDLTSSGSAEIPAQDFPATAF